MYTALDAAEWGVRAGFVHVPSASEAAPEGAPALPLDDIARPVDAAAHRARRPRQSPGTPQ